MAAEPFDIPAPGSSFAFDIYHDNTLRATGPPLPGGPCNYTDQSLPRCGCRRFWSRASLSSGVFQDSNSAELCMCSHHACFHEDVQPGQAQQPAVGNAPGQENQRPKVNREPLSPVQLPSFQVPGSLGSSLDFTLLDFQASVSAPRMEAAHPPSQVHPAQDARPGQDSPMPDTFNSWGDLARLQAGHANGLPPFPAQCLMSPPPPPSTAASSQARYLRPFAGKGLQTLSGASALRPDPRRLERSVLDGAAEPVQEPVRAPAGFAPAPQGLPSQDRSVQGSDAGYQRLVDRVDSHEQRLDRIESNSFSVAGHDDCHDKHEHTDLRVTELESRMEEAEKIINDNGSVVGSRRMAKQDGDADDATASVVSGSTNATVLPSNRAEVYSQLQQLQAQVTQLQASALPSYTKPWELEVVFLPFPLRGVWMDSKEFANQRRSIGSAVEGWTQLPNTLSRATPDPQSPKFQEWAGQGPESNWLLPRAFAAGRIIDQRLKSRGLIKTVLVRGADARSVQLAIHEAFEDVIRISSNSDARGLTLDYPLAEFLGLKQAWVPLRKLHKDSRLRFLSPAEMTTPALWDFTFLVNSVVMKATGVQRLYVTQPEAYLQDHPLGGHALEAGWTWQKLRQLSRVYPDSQSSADVPEADALEECWNWNDRLDEPPSVAASAISLRRSIIQGASRRSSTEPSGQFYTGVQSPILSAGGGPSRSRAQSPLIQRERKGSWPPHIRTGSLPPVGPAMPSPAQSRRRISHAAASATPYERRASPFVPRASPRPSPRLGSIHHIAIPSAAANPAAVPKRRYTRSPSLVPRNTPRWSRTSMSRSPSLAPGGLYGGYQEEREQQNRERRTTTPFYYATPHSEAIPEYGYARAGSRQPSAAPGGGVLRNGYFPDDDEDMHDGEFTEGSGMDTDLYDDEEEEDDSEMADHQPLHHHQPRHRSIHGGGGSSRQQQPQQPNVSFGFGTDGGDEADLDIDVYEDDEEDELDGVDTDAGNTTDQHAGVVGAAGTGTGAGAAAWRGFGRHPHQHHQHQRPTPNSSQRQHQQQQPLRPEDIPWAGIEDTTAAGAAAVGIVSSTTTATATAATAAGRVGVGVGAGGADAEGDSSMSDGENVDPTTSGGSSFSQSGGGLSSSQPSQQSHRGGIEIHQRQVSVGMAQQVSMGGMGLGMGMGGGMDMGDALEEDRASSQAPSEYSSKPGAWQIIPLAAIDSSGGEDGVGVGVGQKGVGGGVGAVRVESSVMGFRIHEDGTAGGVGGEEELLDTQWG